MITPSILIQAGHYPHGGGAPGEAAWTWQLAQAVAARLEQAGLEVTTVGDFYGQPAPPACGREYALFLSLHYDAAIYAARGERNSGCFADCAVDETRPAEARRFIATWESLYPVRTGIPLANQRRNPNTNCYYAFAALTPGTPGVLIEHGCGAPTATGPYPPGDDADFLHRHLDIVADADAAAILLWLLRADTAPAPPDLLALPATSAVGQELVSGRPAAVPAMAETPADLAALKRYFEQLGTPVNLDTAIMRRAAQALQQGEGRGPALSGEYPATSPSGVPVVRQDFTAGICEYDRATGQTAWVELVLHPDAVRQEPYSPACGTV